MDDSISILCGRFASMLSFNEEGLICWLEMLLLQEATEEALRAILDATHSCISCSRANFVQIQSHMWQFGSLELHDRASIAISDREVNHVSQVNIVLGCDCNGAARICLDCENLVATSVG